MVSRARFDHVTAGEPLDLLDVYEGTWKDLRVVDVPAGETASLDAGDCQFLVFVLAGRGLLRWAGQSLEVGPGSALGVPLGETLEVEGSGPPDCSMAVLRLAGS